MSVHIKTHVRIFHSKSYEKEVSYELMPAQNIKKGKISKYKYCIATKLFSGKKY